MKNNPVGNIYDYDIETSNKAGYIDVESSTRKRPSKTAVGKKRLEVRPILCSLSIIILTQP